MMMMTRGFVELYATAAKLLVKLQLNLMYKSPGCIQDPHHAHEPGTDAATALYPCRW